MHSRILAVAAFAAVSAAAAPTSPELLRALADGEDFAEVLQAADPAAPRDARAVWLDDRHVRWTLPAGARRVRLLSSAAGRLQAMPGVVASGVIDATAQLELVNPPESAGDPRFSHVAGTVWRVREGDVARLPDLWRGQLVLVAEDGIGRVVDATGTQLAGALDARYAPAAEELDYGARVAPGGVEFRLWAPTAAAVAVALYDGPDTPSRRVVPLERDDASGGWHATVAGTDRARFYLYLVDVFVPGTGLVRNRVTDPYSLSLCADSRRSAVIDLADPATQPEGWAGDQRPQTVRAATDLVIYELHVRDFSRDDATVPAAHRGKYAAFTHADSAGLRHLRALADAGVTDVHLLPVFDFASVPERGAVTPVVPVAPPDSPAVQAAVAPHRERDAFNWGYDPWHYTAPEGGYATDPDDPLARVREFRAMVRALHAAGLRVGLDVVYNHTMASGQDRQSVLDRIVPGYYQRLNAEGAVEHSTCCANTATEHAMMAKLMIDSAVVWARDYRVDSFRFDLMGHQPRAAMLRLGAAVDAAAGRHIPLIGEGWNFGEVANGARFAQASQLSLPGSGIGTFSDRMRDAARGGRAGDSREALLDQGWLNGLHYAPNAAHRGRDARAELAAAADLVRVGLAGSLRDYRLEGADGRPRALAEFAYGDQAAGYVAEPGEVVNYTENHDNQTLFDNNTLRLPSETKRADRARVQVLGNALVLLSQGVAYLHAGQEIMRSKSLDRNSFNSGDAFNRIDWSLGTNHFGVGLPPAADNKDSWPQMQPLLARAAEIAPGPGELRFARDATLDLLRIRHGSALFRLRSAAEVRGRLHFLNTGPAARHSLVVARIDGQGLAGAGFAAVLYAINADVAAQSVALPAEAGRPWTLHPVQAAPGAGDPRAREARFDARTGELTVPARTAVVFVLPP